MTHSLHAKRVHPFARQDMPDCVPPLPENDLTDRLNTLLNTSGPEFVLNLCPGLEYPIIAPLLLKSPMQEITTLGRPTGAERATIIVNGPVVNGVGHSIAVDGTCNDCDGVKLRHVQINGNRGGMYYTGGGGNIEFGGTNIDQLVEYVHSYDPRGWSCMHIFEGSGCNSVIVQYNHVGPAGDDKGKWADGMSVSCPNAIVRHNMVGGPTDGGLVLFGSPGSQIYNNTIWVETHTMLGGINLVDYGPFNGDYTNTSVYNNIIMGGFSTDPPGANKTLGPNVNDAIIKIGIAMGPMTWSGQKDVIRSAKVYNNSFMGAFGYGMAMSGVTNFTVENNVLLGNTSFIGVAEPNCPLDTFTPPAPFVIDLSHVNFSTVQSDFQAVDNCNYLICVSPPPADGDYWPFGPPGGDGGKLTVLPRALSTIIMTPGASNYGSVWFLPGIMFALLVVGVLVRKTGSPSRGN